MQPNRRSGSPRSRFSRKQGSCGTRMMTNINAANFGQNLSDYLNQAVLYQDIINVSTKNGNAVLISEAEYRSRVNSKWRTLADISQMSIIAHSASTSRRFLQRFERQLPTYAVLSAPAPKLCIRASRLYHILSAFGEK